MTEGNANGIGTAELRRLSRENTLAGSAAKYLLSIQRRIVLYWSLLIIQYLIIVASFIYDKLTTNASLINQDNKFALLCYNSIFTSYTGSTILLSGVTFLFIVYASIVVVLKRKKYETARVKMNIHDYLRESFEMVREYANKPKPYSGKSGACDLHTGEVLPINDTEPDKKGLTTRLLLTLIDWMNYRNEWIKREDLLWRSAWKYVSDLTIRKKSEKEKARDLSREFILGIVVVTCVLICLILGVIYFPAPLIRGLCLFFILLIVVLLFFVDRKPSPRTLWCRNEYRVYPESPVLENNTIWIAIYSLVFPFLATLPVILAFTTSSPYELLRVLTRYALMHDLFTELIRAETVQSKPEVE